MVWELFKNVCKVIRDVVRYQFSPHQYVADKQAENTALVDCFG